MLQCDVDDLWEKLPSIPWPFPGRPLVLNNNEILLVPQKLGYSNSDGIYKYMIDEKQWINIVPYAKEFWTKYHGVALNNDDKDNSMIYICNADNLVIVDINSKKFKEVKYNTTIGQHPRCIYAHNQLHVVGGSANFKHIVYDEKEGKFQEIHAFQASDTGTDAATGFYRHGMVYCQVRDCIFMFGGSLTNDGLFQFSFSTRKWMKIQMELPNVDGSGFGFVVTKDGKYIIIVAGSNKGDTFVIDLDDYSSKKCKIAAPVSSWRYACLVSNHAMIELLTNGYIRQNYKQGYFMVELIKMITDFNSKEDLHCINFSEQGHWRIDASAILNNCD